MDLNNLDPEEALLPLEQADAGSTNEIAPTGLAAPKVVIEYRSRGLPWPLVLPLLGVVALIVVAGERQLMRGSGAELASIRLVAPAEGAPSTAPVSTAVRSEPTPNLDKLPHSLPSTEPLSVNSQPVVEPAKDGPVTVVELIGPPLLKELEKVPEKAPAPVAAVAGPLLPPLPTPPIDALQTTALAHAFAIPEPPVPGPKLATEPTATKKVETPTEPPPTTGTVAPRAVPPADEPLPTREEVLADIQREAEQKKAEQLDLKQFKDEAPELQRKEYLATIREQRPQFLTELHQLILEKKKPSGGDIEGLYERFIHVVDPQLEMELRRLMRRFSGRATLQSKITAYRSLGIPEPAILDITCNEIHRRTHYSRCGCYDPQMYVLAARELFAAQRASQRQSKPAQGSSVKSEAVNASASAKKASSGNRTAARPQ